MSVTAKSATEFDVTFTGNSGMREQPLLAVLDSGGNSACRGEGENPQTDQRRVSRERPGAAGPEPLRSQFYDQTNPQVAMDLDGDFVITWQSAVPIR